MEIKIENFTFISISVRLCHISNERPALFDRTLNSIRIINSKKHNFLFTSLRYKNIQFVFICHKYEHKYFSIERKIFYILPFI